MALEDAVNPIKGVSGPGKYAKRIDRMPSNSYGETKQTAELASGAPLAKTADVRPAPASEVKQAAGMGEVTPLFAPSSRPTEPVTSGIDIGAGPGTDALMMKSLYSNNKVSDALAQMLPYDTTGEIGILYQQALARGM
jgi:hypothetical protein